MVVSIDETSENFAKPLATQAQMHTVLKQFARDLLNGVWMDVLLNDGAILPAFVPYSGASAFLRCSLERSAKDVLWKHIIA